MITRLSCISLSGRGIATLAIAAIMVLAATSARGQGVGSSRGLSSGDGTHTIQGRVYFPQGQSPSTSTVKVSLETAGAIGGMSGAMDRDGTFRFNNLRAGEYTIVLDAGKEYEIARESVRIDPIGAGGRIFPVTILLRLKIDASNPALAGVPPEALDLYQKGSAAARKGEAKNAVGFLSKAVAAYPNFPLALSELGAQYLKLNQLDKATETFQELLKLKPADAAGHLNLGIALFNQYKPDDASSQAKLAEAESHFREAIKLNSPGPHAHYYLGITLIKTKHYDEAEKELQSAISNGGENLAPAHKFLGGLYMSGRKNKEAADELEKYLQLDPKAPNADQIKQTIKDLRSKQ